MASVGYRSDFELIKNNHTLPSRASYGVSFVSLFEKLTVLSTGLTVYLFFYSDSGACFAMLIYHISFLGHVSLRIVLT